MLATLASYGSPPPGPHHMDVDRSNDTDDDMNIDDSDSPADNKDADADGEYVDDDDHPPTSHPPLPVRPPSVVSTTPQCGVPLT